MPKLVNLLLLVLLWNAGRAQSSEQTQERVKQAMALRYTDYQKSLRILNDCVTEYLSNGDTVRAIYALNKVALIHGHHAQYKTSYDVLWRTLSLANQINNPRLIAATYTDLGRYYGFYKREEEAEAYIRKALGIQRKLIEQKKAEPAILLDTYYNLAVIQREFLNYAQAKTYLDSAYRYLSPGSEQIPRQMLDFEKAILLTNQGRIDEAIAIYEDIKLWFIQRNPEYNVLVETHQGLAYQKRGELDKAEASFLKALAISDTYDSHRDFANLVHEYLSEVYFAKGNLSKAYAELKTVKELDNKYFDSRSENNRALLEIQDQFRVDQERAEALLKEQKMKELEAAEKLLFAQRSLLIIALVFSALFGYLYFKYLKNKHRTDKEIARKNQELEIQKAQELIELKNKEVVVSALKLIEKEEIIEEFKSSLEKSDWSLEPARLKKAVKSLEVDYDQHWKEFEARFVEVNSGFYENLKNEFPNLTPTDEKLCALIKLNFSSKEMAKLLGISIESVHTSRYRLRKKLGLEREDNLTEFVAKF